jgi:3',5'-cyclic AMP phosphodiesterase CpdA
MPTLLHLTDPHFGYDKDATARAQREEALGLLVKEVGKLAGEWKPRVLVISGDLTWQGRPRGYDELGEWLTKKLFPATGLTAADCVVCPGNHDIDREAAFSLEGRTDDPKRADALLHPARLAGFAAPFTAFVKFAKEFGVVGTGVAGPAQLPGGSLRSPRATLCLRELGLVLPRQQYRRWAVVAGAAAASIDEADGSGRLRQGAGHRGGAAPSDGLARELRQSSVRRPRGCV